MDSPFALIALIAGVLGAVAAVIVIAPTKRSSKPATVLEEMARFRNRYAELRERQVLLGDRTLASAPTRWKATEVPMLAEPGWILDSPQDIAVMKLTLATKTRGDAESLRAASRVLRGLDLSGPITYSQAIMKSNPTVTYFNGTIYRPTSIVKTEEGGLSISFEPGKYFDYLDTSEVLAYEAALPSSRLGLRKRIVNPFDLTNRVASLGILTLTIKRGTGGSTFIMHKRSGQFTVGNALYHVVPAGEFTPSDVGLAAIQDDLDLWRNIAREYAEELLGMPDAQGTGGRRLDYAGTTPYREMYAALAANTVRVRTFGVALDPLTFKPELLTVVVFDEATFDDVFPEPLPGGPEGVLIPGIPFTWKHVEGYLDDPSTRHGAKACLKLAWQHREQLGL